MNESNLQSTLAPCGGYVTACNGVNTEVKGLVQLSSTAYILQSLNIIASVCYLGQGESFSRLAEGW